MLFNLKIILLPIFIDLEANGRLARKDAQQQRQNGLNDVDDLGGGVKISKVFLNIQRIKFVDNYMKYFRAIIFESGLFSLQQICDCSMSGAPNRFVEVPRPALFPVKLNAIQREWFAIILIWYYFVLLNVGFIYIYIEHVMKEYNIKEGDVTYEKMLQKMKSIACDARKRMKRQIEKRNRSLENEAPVDQE